MFKKYVCNFGLICIAVILTQSSILVSGCKAKSSVTVNWAELSKAWEKYLDYPSSENARKVSKILPDSELVTATNSQEEINVTDTIWNTLTVLERNVYSSDISAVNLGFHLHSIADGGFSEALDMILGALIRINAKLFLEQLQLNRPLIKRLDALVGNLVDYALTNEAARLETSLRIEALKKVKDSKLRKIRAECIEELERQSKDEEE